MRRLHGALAGDLHGFIALGFVRVSTYLRDPGSESHSCMSITQFNESALYSQLDLCSVAESGNEWVVCYRDSVTVRTLTETFCSAKVSSRAFLRPGY